MSGDVTPVRVSVSLSGGAALGAYHAGVLAALLTAVDALRADDPDVVRVDAIGGASAGALAAMFAAHALTHGLDPVELLSEAWVERVSADMLRDDSPRAPLGFAALRERLPEELRPEHWGRTEAGPQATPVGLQVSLAGLRGLRYDLDVGPERSLPAMTYADWGEFVLEPHGGVEQLLTPEGGSVLDFVLASAANPAAFAPQLIDRSAHAEDFAARGIDGLPADNRLWYTDGSSISSEPLGRVLSLSHTVNPDPSGGHLHLFVDPLSELPGDPDAWTGRMDAPSWLDGLKRTLAIMPEQVLHDDLKRVADVNDRFGLLDEFVATLAPHLSGDGVAALRGLLDADHGGDASGTDDGTGDDGADALRAVVARVADLHRKKPVTLDFISPRLLTDVHDRTVPGLLAGEFMGDFGGFVHRTLRRSDFALGYDSVRSWLATGLPRAGLTDRQVERAVAAVEEHRLAEWSEIEAGHADASDLPWESRESLAKLALHTGRVVAGDLWRALRSD